MREIKFTEEESDDDIKYAFDNNGLNNKLSDIDVIVAEVCGENDELSWYWIIKMKDGTFSWVSGWCDYTGWDCRSGVEIKNGFTSAKEAVNNLVISEYDPRKNIKNILIGQIEDIIPFALYQDLLTPNGIKE